MRHIIPLLIVLAFICMAKGDIRITGADAIYNASLSGFDVDTEAKPVQSLFAFKESAISSRNLTQGIIPTASQQLKSLFAINHMALATASLQPVNVATDAYLLQRVFLLHEESSLAKDLLFPLDLMNETRPPMISGIAVNNITSDSAEVCWITDEYADGHILLGTAADQLTMQAYSDLYEINHTLVLEKLSPETRYYYVINSTDRCGNFALSQVQEFVTLA